MIKSVILKVVLDSNGVRIDGAGGLTIPPGFTEAQAICIIKDEIDFIAKLKAWY